MTKGFKKRRLAVALSACMMATSGIVHALGMGEIEVSTALNEPLNAKIKLFSVTPSEFESLGVSLASREAFERVGIDRLPILRELEFELVSSGADAPYIKVLSSKAIKEPFLDFILAINWSSGQMMREYTLLLDPPVFENEQPRARINAAATQPANIVRQATTTAVATQARQTLAGSYGPTSRKDTLWGIARDMRPNRSVSVPQMMIGLLKENPEAFGDNNINNLKAGYILRTPEMGVITELSKQQAAAEANRQFQGWRVAKGQTSTVGRQQRVVALTPASATENASIPAPVATEKASTRSRLQLLTPEEEAKARLGGVGSGAAGDAVESLQRQLAVALESSEARDQENSDLRLRLDELEQQLQSVQKLLTLKDDSLGALQSGAQLKQQVDAATATLKAVKPEVDAVPKQPAKPIVQPVPVSLIDEVLANPMYMAVGGGVIVLLLLTVLAMRRRYSQTDVDDDFGVMAPIGGDAENKADAAGRSAVASQSAEAVSAAVTAEVDENVSIGDFGAGLGAIHTEESEIDPIAEADVYLAYRRYEQAEALLKEAINADAGRHELKVKLLEIYYATKDVDSFEAQAESLYAVLAGQDEVMWNQVVEMGRELLPEHPLFADGSGAPAVAKSSLTESDLGFEPSGGGEELGFDDSQLLSGDDAEINDDELAESLGLSGLADVSDDVGELDGLDTTDLADDLSLDELGDLELDLDLDLSVADEVAMTEDAAVNIALDDIDLGTDGLEASPEVSDLPDELSGSVVADKSLVDASLELNVEQADDVDDLGSITDELAGFGGEIEEAVTLDSDAALTGSLADGVPDELDGQAVDKSDTQVMDIDFVSDEAAFLGEVSAVSDKPESVVKPVLPLVEDDEHLGATEKELPFRKAGRDSSSTDVSNADSRDVDAAQSVYQSRDVEAETDGLLDSARKQDDDDNLIELDISPRSEVDSGEVALGADTKVVELESGASEVEAEIDPLADIASLAEMDFSQMSDGDHDNDDFFDTAGDMIGTKLDLAKAYIDMGDQDGARSILDEVVDEGDDNQRQEAEQLKQQIS